jgi:branched-chain amino acid transport system ATP-binding protein
MSTPVLQVQGISKRFGGLQALSDVGMTIQPGQVYGLIGPNGAGKTTFFNVITGLYAPDSGSFKLAGQSYQPSAVHEVAAAGIARTFQNIRLFADMTALENVMVGRHVRTRSGVLGAVFRTKAFVQEELAIAQRARRRIADPAYRHQTRLVANEPGVEEIVRGAGLAGEVGPPQRQRTGGGAGEYTTSGIGC